MASALGSLLPTGTLRAGTAVSVEDGDLPLLLALAAGAAAGASWAVVGLPQLGGLAAAGAGLDLDAGLWVDQPGREWPQVLAVLLEAVAVVVLGPPGALPERAGRRLAALQRRTGAVLLVSGPWPGAQVQLRIGEATWEGMGSGHGVLRGRRVRVVASGRGAGASVRSVAAWLPGPDGLPAPITTGSRAVGEPVSKPLTGAG